MTRPLLAAALSLCALTVTAAPSQPTAVTAPLAASAAAPVKPPLAAAPLNPFTGQPPAEEQLLRAQRMAAPPELKAVAPVAPPASPPASSALASAAPASSPAAAASVKATPASAPTQQGAGAAILAAVAPPAKAVAAQQAAGAACDCKDEDKGGPKAGANGAAAKPSAATQARTNGPATAPRIVKARPSRSTAFQPAEVDGLLPVPRLLAVVHNAGRRTAVFQLRADGSVQSFSDGESTPWGRLMVLDAHAVDVEGRTLCVPGYETQGSASALPSSSVPVIRVGGY